MSEAPVLEFNSVETVSLLEIDQREKEEVAHLQKLIKEVQGIEERLQQQYVRLTGNRCH